MNEYETEIRFSGVPEFKIGKDLNVSRAQNPTSKEIFDHEQANILGVFENLGLKSVGVSGFRRLGKFDPTRLKPRQILVKFSDSHTVETMLARSPMLKLYEPTKNGRAYRVFLSKIPEQKKTTQRTEIVEKEKRKTKQR